ncbi:MAG: hypothetical protein HYY06_33320 [Deltaproteobacteria bacterium]|nr:hypothetical protein [Deltaproteobacteria bacterium]
MVVEPIIGRGPIVLTLTEIEVAQGWRLVGDVSYVRIGESGDSLSEDGLGLTAGFLREWALGSPEGASLFPHIRAQLVFEATSTRHASSSKLIAGRGGAGLDFRFVPHASLDLDLELGMGLLSIGGGSGDSAVFELTAGGALRVLFDLG